MPMTAEELIACAHAARECEALDELGRFEAAAEHLGRMRGLECRDVMDDVCRVYDANTPSGNRPLAVVLEAEGLRLSGQGALL